MEWMPQAVRDGIIVVLVISGPLVLAAAFIGLLVGILQAATQVQEQTIGSALKIIGVFGIIIFAGFWMFQYLNNYTARTLSTAFTFVPRQTQKVIPANVSGEESEDNFKEKIDTEAFGRPLRVTPLKEIETKSPGGVPPGIPYLGTPEIPKPPSVSKLLPAEVPQIPMQVIKPNIPLDFQEPMSITPPVLPMAGEIPQDAIPEQNNVDMLQINVVPGEPTGVMEETDADLWQRKGVFSLDNENPEQVTAEVQ